MRTIDYPLERLYAGQDFDWVVDTVPGVLAWVPGSAKQRHQQPFRFMVHHESAPGQRAESVQLSLRWDLQQLSVHDRSVKERAARMRAGRTAHREHDTELAAYGLALVAVSVFLPGRRVVSMRKGLPPDLLLDVTPGALRGVEVAGRSRGGSRVLEELRRGNEREGAPGKQPLLLARADVVEAHLSLWCASPHVAVMAKVKP
ncbi:hypothetical protein [Pyxidicoccus xibeiensis]|uniref:hypothetical protein n=1 Tax=Pyxidicoccus xibeiensis TaxID=2906759 RepID=UPI0020A7126E|nr:hypothetical protein [Pyxidicoccus xibeiensis]MCP3135831.1 hypothetical protein [Pyxidicoccus xibeiensis]